MATSSTEESLEFWLSKAVNVLNKDADWEAIVGFCDRINKESEGPPNALRLLVHKIQSPQEKEAMLALLTIEACVKNCGRRFQLEIGKFRFLNEIIKVISPKFMGNFTSPKVKQKCIELLFYWTEVLEYEPKIKDAYQMLKKQGIVKQDPTISDWSMEASSPPPPPPPPAYARNSIFEDEDKSKLLARLLRSKNADDLMAANRLIKNMVKQDAERSEKVSQRIQEIDVVYNNVKLLNDMLHNYQPGGATLSDKEIMKELYDNLEKHRPKLFRLASDADESDENGISEILKANDEVIQVMALYEDTVVKTDVNNLLIDAADTTAGASAVASSDLQMLNAGGSDSSASQSLSDLMLKSPPSLSILDDQLQKLGLGSVSMTNGFEKHAAGTNQLDELSNIFANSTTHSTHTSMVSSSIFNASSMPFSTTSLQPSLNNVMTRPTVGTMMQPPVSSAFQPTLFNATVPLYRSPAATVPTVQGAFPVMSVPITRPSFQPAMPVPQPAVPLQPTPLQTSPVRTVTSSAISTVDTWFDEAAVTKSSAGLQSLDAIGRSALMSSLSSATTAVEWNSQQSTSLQSKTPMNQMSKASSQVSAAAVNTASVAGETASNEILPLTDVFVPLDTIHPGRLQPLIAYDKNGIKIMFHFGKDRPRPDTLVVAVSVMNSNTTPIKGFVFQAAVPKVMKIKLQPASASDLPAYNPILPLAAITQVMLIAHRSQDKILLRFKITYSIKDALTTDVGEVQFSSLSKT